jgi:hypothetical protein
MFEFGGHESAESFFGAVQDDGQGNGNRMLYAIVAGNIHKVEFMAI